MDNTALAKKIYNQQLMYGWPGLVNEGVRMCEEIGIPDVTKVKASEKDFKLMLKEACRLKDQENLKLAIQSKEKLNLLKESDCKQKEYITSMTLSEVRTLFGHKTRMTKNAGNYRNWHKYRG